MSSRLIFAATLILALGCTARASGGGPSVGSDAGATGADTGVTASSCDALCARLTGVAGCTPSSVAACVGGCQQLAQAPASCQLAAASLRACVGAAAVNCAAPSLPLAGCDAQLSAYGACLGGALVDAAVTPTPDVVTPPPADTGGADPCASATECASCAERPDCGWCDGRCSRGTSAGPVGRSCQSTAWVWTSSACAAAPFDSGINNPLISGACQSCAIGACIDPATRCLGDAACQQCLLGAITPSCRANPNVAALISCACEGCRGACGVECASLGL